MAAFVGRDRELAVLAEHLALARAGRSQVVAVEGDPGNDRDFLWRRLTDEGRAALTVPFATSSDGVRATFPITVQA